MPSRLPGLRPLQGRRCRAFRACREGATAVEFAMVAMPFFALMFAIIETALVFWSNQVLETAVANASRQIYTGQFQTDASNKGLTPEQLRDKFKTLVCSYVTAVFDCAAMVTIDVRSVKNYGEAAIEPPINRTTKAYDTTGYGYSAPGSGVITVVRATMEYPVFTNFLAPSSGLASGKRLIIASATFRTEPYSQ